MNYIAALFVLLFLGNSYAGEAVAQGASKSAEPDLGKREGSLEVSPALLDVTLEKPDEEKILRFTYTNHSKQFVSVELFPIDFKQKDGVGAISFLGQESLSYSYSLSSYLSFESRSLELAPFEKKEFLVRVKNRMDLTPGGHYAAVIGKVTSGAPNEATRFAPSVSSLILLRKIGGERFNLSLREVNFPQESVVFSYPKSIRLTFRNEGNIHLVPYGRVEIVDMFGRLIYKGAMNVSSFRVFPSSIRLIPVVLTQQTAWQMPVSVNTIRVEGKDSLKKTQYKYEESFLYVNPWAFGVIVVVVVLLLVRRVRRK